VDIEGATGQYLHLMGILGNGKEPWHTWGRHFAAREPNRSGVLPLGNPVTRSASSAGFRPCWHSMHWMADSAARFFDIVK